MTKTICWAQHASEWQSFIPLAQILTTLGYRHIFVCKTRVAYEQYKKAGFEAHLISDIFFATDDISDEECARYDSEYGPPFIRNICESDVHIPLIFSSARKAEKLIGRAFRFWETFLAEHSVDYIIARETATLLTRPIYAIAKKRGIPFGQLTVGHGAGYTILYDVGEYHIWSELESEIAKGIGHNTPEMRARVDAFVKKRVPPTTDKMRMRFVPVSFFKALKNYLGLVRADTRRSFRDDPVHVATLRYGRLRLRKQLEWKYVTQYFFHYDSIREGERFVYFPIYSGLETSYLTHIPFWARNEVALIKTVARNLPAGVFLYVKEHPHNPGDLSYKELRELSRVPNIRIIRPEVSSQFLIEKSEFVFVFEGSAGWEAFLTKNKVVSFGGHPFFACSSLVYTFTDLNKIGEVMMRVLQEENQYEKRIEEWYWFIDRVLATSGMGDIANPNPPYGFVAEKALLTPVAAYIDQTLRRRYQLLPEKKN